ncbi:MAG: hypothetical protein ACREP9_11805 [Candidatus Dormibacteraceae bacterium]
MRANCGHTSLPVVGAGDADEQLVEADDAAEQTTDLQTRRGKGNGNWWFYWRKVSYRVANALSKLNLLAKPVA